MKKIISLNLAILMIVLSFAGCSNKTPTMEELEQQAIDVNMIDINKDSTENIVKAKENYCNKILKLDGQVLRIKEEYVELGCAGVSSTSVNVYLPQEDLAKLEFGQRIIVLGRIADEVEDILDEHGFRHIYYQMPDAILVQDVF